MGLHRLLLALLLPLGLGCAMVVLMSQATPGDREPRPSRTTVLRVLADWDERRAEAWAAGDARALAALYGPGSPAGRSDVTMLRRWTSRGLTVSGLRMQVLDVDVRSRSAERLVVVVTDRVAAGEAVGPAGRTPLPRDAVSTREVVLERAGEWRVVRVRPLPAPR